MNKTQKWLIAIIAFVAAFAVGVTWFLTRPSTPVASPTPTPSVTVPSTSPTATPSSTPTVAPSTSPTTPSSSPTATPSQSTTVDDPTANWGTPYNCDEFPGFSHLGVCKVKGKTAAQVFDICRAAGRYFVWSQSGGKAGSAKDEMSYDQYMRYSAVCMQGVGMKVTDLSGLSACPEGCVAPDAKGLQYILLVGDVDGDLVPAFFDAKTGEVIDNSKEYKKIQNWIKQFERG